MQRSWANGLSGVLGTPMLLRQRLQQGFGLLEVSGVKALGEPAVDRRQQLVGLGALALLLPQAGQAGGGAQLPGFGLLAAGNGEGLLEAGFGLGSSGMAWRSSNSPWSRYASASMSPRPLSSHATSASASRRSPSSTWPACPRASASRTRQNGRDSICPVARTAARPWCICARPASPWPCMASAQPRHDVPTLPRAEIPARSPGSGGPRPAPGPPAPHGGGDAGRPQSGRADARLRGCASAWARASAS